MEEMKFNMEEMDEEMPELKRAGRPKDTEEGMVRLANGKLLEQDVLMNKISQLKQLNMSNTGIAEGLGLSSPQMVSYYWNKLQRKVFESRSRTPEPVLIGELLEMLKGLRVEAYQLLRYINKKEDPATFINASKCASDMLEKEIKFMERMKILKPQIDKTASIAKEAQSMTVDELKTKLRETKTRIMNLDSGEKKGAVVKEEGLGYNIDEEYNEMKREMKEGLISNLNKKIPEV